MTTATISLTNNTALNIIVRGNITLNVVGNGTVRVYVRGQGRDGQEGITAVLMAPVLGNGSGGAGVVAREGEVEEGGKWGTEGDREGGGGRGGGGIEKRGGVEGPGRGGMPLGLEAPTTGHSSHDDTIQGGYNDRGDDVGKDSYGHDPEYEDDDDEFRDAQLILDDTAPSSAPRFEFQIPVSNLPPPEKVTEVFHTVAPETEPRSMSITPEPSHAQQEHLHDTEMEGATPGIEAELPTRLDDNHNRRCMNMELELEHSTAQEAGPQASSRRSFPGKRFPLRCRGLLGLRHEVYVLRGRCQTWSLGTAAAVGHLPARTCVSWPPDVAFRPVATCDILSFPSPSLRFLYHSSIADK